ncbi:MAG: PaaI family thioesterase [Bacteroidales bacterium]|nr:PaaI family thioesterase [Bacteroidales bacterium]MBQ2452651.1 PaaI family thioesterase [Bacteroidales bacterium]
MKALQDFLNKEDRFAHFIGAHLVCVEADFAQAELLVEEHHLNGGSVCQGGVMFTLADLALAAVLNASGNLTLGVENSITFVRSARLGEKLVAKARLIRDHKKLPFCTVEICNEAGDLLAHMSALGYRKEQMIQID